MEWSGLIIYHLWSIGNDCQVYCVGESKAMLWLSRKETYDWLAASAAGEDIENYGVIAV